MTTREIPQTGFATLDEAIAKANELVETTGGPVEVCQEDGFSGRYIIAPERRPGRWHWRVSKEGPVVKLWEP